MDLRDCPKDGMANPSSSSLLLLEWWTDSIEVVVSATVWMLPELLGISFSANETLITRSRVLMPRTLCTFPARRVVSVTPLFTYPTQLVETTGMTIDKSETSLPPSMRVNHNAGADSRGTQQVV